MAPKQSAPEPSAAARAAVEGGCSFTLNGKPVEFTGSPMARLLDVLRERFHLTGTKEGCGEGECGSCTVLLDGEVVCSCLVPVFQVAGREVRTIEDLAKEGTLDPLQDAFVREGGVQCGACTPGLIVTARALLDRVPHPDREEVRRALAGNLCRCTGYEGIHRAIEAAVATSAETSTPTTSTAAKSSDREALDRPGEEPHR
jgi:carbon-monoxide dehydrogenase small subunit